MQNFQVKLGNNNFKQFYHIPQNRPSSNMYGRVQPHMQNPIRLIPDVKFNVGTQRSSFPLERVSHTSTQDNIQKQNNNIQQMKLRLDRLIKQTEIMSERKNYSGQKIVSPQLENHSKYVVNSSYGGNRLNVSFSPETKVIPHLHQSNAQFSNSVELKPREQIIISDQINRIGPNIQHQRSQKTQPTLDNEQVRTIKKSGQIKNSISSDNIKSLSPIIIREDQLNKLNIKQQNKSTEQRVGNEQKSDRNEPLNNSNNKTINVKNTQANYSPINIISSSRKKKDNDETESPLGVLQWKTKVTQLSDKIKKVEDELEEAREGKEYYRKQLSQEWRNNKKEKEQKDKRIQQLKQSQKRQIQEMGRKIKVKEDQILSLISQASELKTVLSQNNDQKGKLNLQTFRKENERLANLLIERDKQLFRMQSLNKQKDNKIIEDKNEISKLKSEIAQLRKNRSQSFSNASESFDGILKDQLKYINQLKSKVESLQQQNNQLRQKLVQESRRTDGLVNQVKIVELKQKSALNNIKISTSIELENKDNIISSLNKKIQTLEDKYRLAISDIKTKDEFFKNYLVGRADTVDLKQSLEKSMKLYIEKSLTSNQYENLKLELEKAKNKIQIYERFRQNQNGGA